MKHSEASLKTMKAMAASLKRHMENKPLSRITISEICTDCGINRKTFYYHFQDIYALLRWMLDREAVEIVKKSDLINDYDEVLRFTFDYVKQNKLIINCAYDAIGREGMKLLLAPDLIGVISKLITEIEIRMDTVLDKSFKDFLCDFYTNALSGMLIDWFQGTDARSEDEMIEYLILTVKSSIPNVIAKRTGKTVG